MARTDRAGAARTVGDEMVRRPTTLPAHATVAEVAALLGDDHVHMALLRRGDRLVGTVTRADLDASRAAGDLALTVARLRGRTVAPGASLAVVRAQMVATAQRRLAVVDPAGRLLGLLCLKESRRGFCSDRDVAARAAAADPSTRFGARAAPATFAACTPAELDASDPYRPIAAPQETT